jgi:hypothetical protein
MQAQRNALLTAALAASLMLLHADAALARSKKSSSGDLGIHGTPTAFRSS